MAAKPKRKKQPPRVSRLPPKPVFEILEADGHRRGKRICTIYADGRVDGFRRPVVVVNSIPKYLDLLIGGSLAGIREIAERVRKDLFL